jgi:hypothetical protein
MNAVGERNSGFVAVALANVSLQARNPGNPDLTGVIVAPIVHLALLQERGKPHTVRVREGATLGDGHWTLVAVELRGATFSDGGERRHLILKPDAPVAMKQPNHLDAAAEAVNAVQEGAARPAALPANEGVR